MSNEPKMTKEDQIEDDNMFLFSSYFDTHYTEMVAVRQMICGTCGQRYADFPEKDWRKTSAGFIPKTAHAVERREAAFCSDEAGFCGSYECEEMSCLLADYASIIDY